MRPRFYVGLTAGLVLSLAAAVIDGTANAQSNVFWPNDECSYATPIAGDGAWGFDTSSPFVTTSLPPLPTTCPGCTCGTTFTGIASDVWYLWTATCTGAVEMTTGVIGESWCNLDTVLAVYDNSPCPVTALPIVCCDDTCAALGSTCDLGSYVTFDVECGEQYLVRLGMKPGTGGGVGTLKINCTGVECPPAPVQVCADCCGAKPHFDDKFYTANYTGQVAVVTGNDDTTGPSFYPVVTIFNLQCSAPPPVPGQEWNPVVGGATTAFRYSGPTGLEWTKDELGSVFGLTLDNQGNIFVAHANIYGLLSGGSAPTCFGSAAAIGSLSQSSSTSVYKIPAGSGIPQLFVNLPGGSTQVSDPGLGNLTYDCEHEEFFVSHFGNGRIYRISLTGTILGWYHHATDTIGLGTHVAPPGGYPDFVPLGERVWAVQAHEGRLYYSVWGQNRNVFSPASALAVVGTTPNRVWSIELDGSGDFMPSSRQQEVMPPHFPGNASAPAANIAFSSPISDISFSPTCKMLLAERDMSIDNCTLSHAARALEYEYIGTSWLPSNFRSGYGYEIGSDGPGSNLEHTNSAGGCDYDMPDPDDCAAGRLWVTADFMTLFPFAYGFTGIDPSTAFGYFTAFHVDYDSVLTGTDDKTKQGDIEIPCRTTQACLNLSNEKILCPTDGSGCYTYSFDLTNKSGLTVQFVTVPLHPTTPSGSLIPGITINPNHINLLVQDGSFLDDGETTSITLTICGGNPGDEFCVELGLVTPKPDFVECCFQELCVELPECDCGQLSDQVFSEVSCDPDGTTSFTYSFNLENLSDFAADQILFIPATGEDAEFVKDFFFLPPLASGASLPMTVQIAGAEPGEEFCFSVLLQHPGTGEDCCCGFQKCITVPPCPEPLGCCTPTIPGGGVGPCSMTTQADCDGTWMPGASCFGGPFGGCIPDPFPVTCQGDLNFDGAINGLDLAMLLGQWTGASAYRPCPPNSAADCNQDCLINGLDLGMLLGAWGSCR